VLHYYLLFTQYFYIMSWLLYISFFGLLLFIVSRWKFFELPGVEKRVVGVAFVAKVLAGVGITLLYTYYYTDKENSDIYKYFGDGLFLNSLFYSKPLLFFKLLLEVNIDTPEVVEQVRGFNHWDPKVRSYLYNDSRFIIKLNALLGFLSMGNVYTHSLFAAFFGFVGLTAFVRGFNALMNADAVFESFDVSSTKVYAFLLFFFPSVLMWSSAMLKETILVLVFGLFVWLIVEAKEHFKKAWLWLVLVVMMGMMGIFKVYVLLSFIVAGLFFVSTKLVKVKWQIGLWSLGFMIVVPLVAVAVDYFLLNGAVLGGIEKKQWDSIRLAEYMKAGSVVFIPAVEAGKLWSFVKAVPFALWNVLCAPMIWNVRGLMLLPLAVENLVLTLLLVVLGFNVRRFGLSETRLFFAVIVFCYLLFVLIGITTPVLGSIVRYRVPGIILLLMPISIALRQPLASAKG